MNDVKASSSRVGSHPVKDSLLCGFEVVIVIAFCWICGEVLITPLLPPFSGLIILILPIRLLILSTLLISGLFIANYLWQRPVSQWLLNAFDFFPAVTGVLGISLSFNAFAALFYIPYIFHPNKGPYIELKSALMISAVGMVIILISYAILFVGGVLAVVSDWHRLKYNGPPKSIASPKKTKKSWRLYFALVVPTFMIYGVYETEAFPVSYDTVRFQLTANSKQRITREFVNKWTITWGDNYKPLIREYLERGADINAECAYHGTPLMWAVKESDIQFVKELLDKGADVNAKRLTGTTTDLGKTALMYAIESNRPDVFALLVSKGADVNAKNNNGTTALMNAAWISNPIYFDTLLNAGASVGGVDYLGETTLSYSLQRSGMERINKLIKLGATIDPNGTSGRTALERAITARHISAVKLLVDMGVVPDKQLVELAKSDQYRDSRVLQELGLDKY